MEIKGGGPISAEEYKDNFNPDTALKSKIRKCSFSTVLMVDIGESGEFVSSDESWVDDARMENAPNGFQTAQRSAITVVKMAWNVTRWWPNGQNVCSGIFIR